MYRFCKHNIFERIKIRVEDKDINVSLIALSIVTNTILAIFKLIFGFYLESFWLILHAVYFIFLGFARYKTMKNYIYIKNIEDSVKKYEIEFAIHNRSGGFIFLIGAAYLALCLRMYLVGDVVLVGGILVYCFMTFAAFKNAFAIYGLVITRRKETPVIRVMKVIGIVDASLSIVPVLYTSMSYFGIIHSAEVPAVVGIIISVCVMTSGIIMSNRPKERYLNNYMAASGNKE